MIPVAHQLCGERAPTQNKPVIASHTEQGRENHAPVCATDERSASGDAAATHADHVLPRDRPTNPLPAQTSTYQVLSLVRNAEKLPPLLLSRPTQQRSLAGPDYASAAARARSGVDEAGAVAGRRLRQLVLTDAGVVALADSAAGVGDDEVARPAPAACRAVLAGTTAWPGVRAVATGPSVACRRAAAPAKAPSWAPTTNQGTRRRPIQGQRRRPRVPHRLHPSRREDPHLPRRRRRTDPHRHSLDRLRHRLHVVQRAHRPDRTRHRDAPPRPSASKPGTSPTCPHPA
ncbi:hypothetical protein SAMN02787118_101714 [Streptomyces mirabilis]|jgi:hypothetical protein|uniref:Uncharacterized protein n=1 Tax=Streptomyces mirabilis TaxID=68239 RepID=A0A1I2AJZ3_9ACTN|nr:hypothetical protein SAMN02787118_101714 [Streptomyces mirabilis]